jgi:hypothetical protein
VAVNDGPAGMDSSAAAAAYQPMTLRAINVMMEIRYSSCEQGQRSRLVRHSIVCLFSAMTESIVRAWGGTASVPASESSVSGSVQPDDALGNNRMRISRATAKQQVRGLLLKLLFLLLLLLVLLVLLVLGRTQSKAGTEEKSGSETDRGKWPNRSGLVWCLLQVLLESFLECSGQSSTIGESKPKSNRLLMSVSMVVSGGEGPVEWAMRASGDRIVFHKSVSG